MKHLFFSVIKFPIFVSLSLILILALFFGISLHNYYLLGLSPSGIVIFTVVFILMVILISSWILILMSTHRRIRPVLLLRYSKLLLINVYYYMGKYLALLFGQSKESIYESFLNLNNEIVFTNFSGIPKEEILVLLPHCLQSSECKIRIVDELANCEECGACDIARIKQKLLPLGTKLSIAPGGTVARDSIIRLKPRVIIAVACHRELIEGVRDSFRYPVFALLNERPKGPCKDTVVSVPAIEFAINKFQIQR